jgi:hypothetical protein
MAKKSGAGVAPVALRPALPRSARQATTKPAKPSVLLDTFEATMMREDCEKGFFVSFE